MASLFMGVKSNFTAELFTSPHTLSTAFLLLHFALQYTNITRTACPYEVLLTSTYLYANTHISSTLTCQFANHVDQRNHGETHESGCA
jgi:hypothetical protein